MNSETLVRWGAGLVVFVVLGLAALGGLEWYVDRIAWMIDPSWYRIEQTTDEVEFGCQKFRPTSFSSLPEEGVTRILMLGGSTTFGFPNRPTGDEPLSSPIHGFVGVVQASVDAQYPGQFEFVNLGINGGGTVDTLRVLRKAQAWGASAMVVYDGNNEFLAAPARFSARMWASALYRQLTLLLPRPMASPGWVGPPAYGTPSHRQAILDLFEDQLSSIVQVGQERGLKVLVSTQAVNTRLVDPNWSITGDASTLIDLDQASEEELVEGLNAHPDSADLAWALAVRRSRSGVNAESLYQAATDNDGLQLRASSEINAAIRSVAQEEGAWLVDAALAIRREEQQSTNPYFYDWVHPRPNGARIIARGVLDGLQGTGIIPDTPIDLIDPDVPTEDRIEGEVRAARSWLQWACVRQHDPTHRLSMARASAARVLSLQPEHPEALAIHTLIEGWNTPPVSLTPAMASRLGSMHDCLARRMEP